MRWSVSAMARGSYALDSSVEDRYESTITPSGVSAWVKRTAKNYHLAYWRVMPEVFDYLLVALLGIGCLAIWRDAGFNLMRGLLLAPLCILPVVPIVALTARLLVPTIPCVVLWAANGLKSVCEGTPSLRTRRLQLTLMSALLISYAKPNFDLIQDYRTGGVALEEKTAGAWIDAHLPADALLMNRKSAIPFYAPRQSITTPYASLPEIVAYAREKHVTHLVVSERFIALRPQLEPLLVESRYPGLEIAYDQPSPPGWKARVKVFRVSPGRPVSGLPESSP